MHAAGQKAERVLPIDDASKVTFAVAFLVLRPFWGHGILEGGGLLPWKSLCQSAATTISAGFTPGGKSYVSPLVVVYALKNRTKNVRVGITTSKKVGNAVQRNRSRRVIREAFRALAPRVRPGFDLVLVARGKTPYVKSTDVRRQLERQLQAAGLLREETP